MCSVFELIWTITFQENIPLKQVWMFLAETHLCLACQDPLNKNLGFGLLRLMPKTWTGPCRIMWVKSARTEPFQIQILMTRDPHQYNIQDIQAFRSDQLRTRVRFCVCLAKHLLLSLSSKHSIHFDPDFLRCGQWWQILTEKYDLANSGES